MSLSPGKNRPTPETAAENSPPHPRTPAPPHSPARKRTHTDAAATPRIDRLRARMAEQKVPALLVLSPLNIGYLTGFTGSAAALIVTPERAVFITDSRYQVQAARECPGFEIVLTTSSAGYEQVIAETAKRLGVPVLFVEAEALTVARYEALKKKARKKLEGVDARLSFKPVSGLVEPLRRVKDAGEIAKMRAACALADRGFEYALTLVRPGVTERKIAVDLEYFLKSHGAEKEAFDTIVVSGERSALPHGHPSDKALAEGDFVTFDFGARLDGYNSDLTRTVVVGRASAEQREVYGIVLEAQLAGIAAIRPGAEGKAVDEAARAIIRERGHGEHFGHSLGHGLGRSVHDHPALAATADVKLEPGMIVTVEPGIYVEGWGGVRIEDDVLVTEDGCEILTHAPKELIELGG